MSVSGGGGGGVKGGTDQSLFHLYFVPTLPFDTDF